MQTYIVRQPILDINRNSVGYEVLFQDGDVTDERKREETAASAIDNFLSQMNTEEFLDGKQVYITFTPNLLIKNIPSIFSPKDLVIQIEDSLIINPEAQKAVYKYHEDGYIIALNGFEFTARFFSILQIIDIMKVDCRNIDDPQVGNIIRIAEGFGKEVIAYNINSQEAYDYVMSMGVKYMQGSFIADNLPSEVKSADHLQSNFFRLIVAVTKDEPDIAEISSIIERDVTLSYSLLKLVNSAYFALKNRVSSINQALIILGLGQLKQWIYLLSFKNTEGTAPFELIKTSFLRASFASELCEFAEDMPISKSEAYLLGMFSTLGILLDVPLEQALEQVGVSDEVRNALLEQEGKAGLLYKLILCYEKADFKGITVYAKLLRIPDNIITQKYFECVENVNNIWNELMSSELGAADIK